MRAQCFTTSKLQGEPIGRRSLATGKPNEHFTQQMVRNALPRTVAAPNRKPLSVKAQAANKGGPPDVPKPRGQQVGKEWLQSIFSRFGPVKEKASNTTVLDFEKPLVELDNRIKEVRILHSCLYRDD